MVAYYVIVVIVADSAPEARWLVCTCGWIRVGARVDRTNLTTMLNAYTYHQLPAYVGQTVRKIERLPTPRMGWDGMGLNKNGIGQDWSGFYTIDREQQQQRHHRLHHPT